MQMREFLVLPAVDNEPVGCQVELVHQDLRGSDKVCQEWVGRIQVRKGTDWLFSGGG